MAPVYELFDAPYIPPDLREDESSFKPKEELKEQSESKPKKVYKKRAEKSPLDKVVDEILSEKKEKDYSIIEYTDDEYNLFYEDSLKMWEAMREQDKLGFDMDKSIFILIYLISQSFINEQSQKQVIYGVSSYNMGGKKVSSINYTNYISYDDRIKEGYFTRAEKDKIMEKIYPLSQSVYRKYVPGDDCFVGPYEREDIREAINLGLTKAFNSYVPFSKNSRVSFSSWAYTCMDNACLDVIKHYNSDKEKIIKVSLEDTAGSSNGKSDDDSSQDKRVENLLATNTEGEEFDNANSNEDRRKFLEEVFENMLKEGEAKVVNREIFVLKAYFGFLTGSQETFSSIASITNIKMENCKKIYQKAKERLVRTVFKMGYTADEVISLFLD